MGGTKTALRGERRSLCLSCVRAVPPGQEEPSALAGLPALAQRFLQLLPVGCIAPLQALQLLVLFLVQDAQEVLQLREAEGFPLLGDREEYAMTGSRSNPDRIAPCSAHAPFSLLC